VSIGPPIALGIAALGAALLALTFEHPPTETVQRGYRGLGMIEVYNPSLLARSVDLNRVPEAQPPEDPSGTKSSANYQNVQVLGDVDASEFLRLMAAITEWVAPEQGCTYCHDQDNLAADTVYTKVVARRMLQMTRHINADWKSHVASTGVTCFTCHRGQPVPANIWFADPGPVQARGFAGDRAQQNAPAPEVGKTSLPHDVFTPFLEQPSEIRVISETALRQDNRHSIKQAEWTYGLMMSISQSLGVNCTYCHNSRSFFDWDQSTPQRAVAWHGIRLVRDLNTAYLDPLKPQFPAHRLGPLGDAPKINCATCHQGAYKPLFGASMVTDYPELASEAK
jgi:photosynthetic reaction center cytochrome c subunit